jgi:hypothetical protein
VRGLAKIQVIDDRTFLDISQVYGDRNSMTECEIVEGRLWGICDQDEHGTTIRITRAGPFDPRGPKSELTVIGRLGWDPRFPQLHLIEYQHVEYSVDYGASLIVISCEEGPGQIAPSALEAIGIYKTHDATQRGFPAETLRSHVEEYRSIFGNAPYQWLAIVIQGNIQTIPDRAFVCASRPKQKLSVPIIDMRDSHVRTIGSFAFAACKYLRHVFFSRVLESIGDDAFQNSVEFSYVTVPRSLTTVAARICPGNSGRTTLNIDDGVPYEHRVKVELQEESYGEGTAWVPKYDITGGPESVTKIRLFEGRFKQKQRHTKPKLLTVLRDQKPDECSVY